MSLHDEPVRKVWPGFPDSGEMAALVRVHDWSATPLGPIEAWPQSLKTAVDLMLSSHQPVYVAWGPELTSLYNDGYIPIVGAKHPSGLGKPFDELWWEIREEYRPLVEAVMAGEAQHFVDRPAALGGRDGVEVGYFTFSWTPLRDEAGVIRGFICNGLETTERVEAGRAFRRMFEASPTPFLVLASDAPRFTIVEVNDAYLAAVMRTREELLGRGVFEAMPDNPDDPAATGVTNLRASLDRAIATKRPDAMPRQRYDIPHPNGGFEERWWDPVNSPLLGAGGEVEALIHHVVDVTEQHRAQERLRNSEAKLRAVIEEAPLAMVLTGTSGEILFRNPRFDKLWGRPPHATTARTYSEVYEGYHLDGRPIASEEWPGARALLKGEVVDNDVYEIVQANGQRITCWFGGAPIRDASGGTAGAVVVFRDVSEERRTEARLRESEARYRTLFENIDAGFCIVEVKFDEEGRAVDHFIVEVNPAFERHTGIAGAAGRWASEVMPGIGQFWHDTYASVVRTGQAVRFESAVQPFGRWHDVHAFRTGEPGQNRVAVLFNDISARRNAELALQESETRFRLMADAVPQIVWITDRHGTMEFLNRQFVAYTGASTEAWSPAEMAARFMHASDGAKVVAAFDTALGAGEPFEIEHRIRSAAGEDRWFLARAEPYRDEASGEIVRWFGASVDIHDRKLAEERLRELNTTLEERVAERTAERNMLANIVETTDVMIMAIDLDYNILAINAANVDEFERIYGVRPHAGDNILELLAGQPEQQVQVRAGWARGLQGEHVTFVEDFGDPDRVRPYYEIKFRPLRNEAGEQIGAYQFVTDVTDRLRKEARLREAEAGRRAADALYRAYFEHSPEALFVIGVEADGSFVVEQVNPAHEAGLGFKLDEVRGKRIEEILPVDIAERVLGTYRRVLEGGEIVQYRETYDLGGSPKHWDTSIVPVRDAEGRIVRLIGSSRDVTRQVIAEEALRQSQKLESMGQLTGGVAHDFNNLLTPIIGSLDMLQRRGLGGEREQRLISGAVQSAERAKTLVQRLLAFARRQPLQPIPVDLGQLVEGMADLVASTSGPRVRVELDIAPEVPAVTADPNQLEMAILNLAVNARDAMPEGGALTIAAKPEAMTAGHRSSLAPGRYVRLSVSDTGIGMDSDTARRAIEPFFSTKGVGKGTGLGLSMVHGLAAQLGGAMTIQSRRGIGTTIELWLPVADAKAAETEKAERAVGAAAAGTALLVDDEELVRASTADMLSDLGYAVVEAASAEEALRLVDGGLAPDVVVTDHLMPGMTGTDFARVLKGKRSAPKVLIISGYAEDEGVAPDLPRLTKPFRQDELAASLAALVEGGD